MKFLSLHDILEVENTRTASPDCYRSMMANVNASLYTLRLTKGLVVAAVRSALQSLERSANELFGGGHMRTLDCNWALLEAGVSIRSRLASQ